MVYQSGVNWYLQVLQRPGLINIISDSVRPNPYGHVKSGQMEPYEVRVIECALPHAYARWALQREERP
eukprot:2298424-Alexandrium_andersonii.AAC.1